MSTFAGIDASNVSSYESWNQSRIRLSWGQTPRRHRLVIEVYILHKMIIAYHENSASNPECRQHDLHVSVMLPMATILRNLRHTLRLRDRA